MKHELDRRELYAQLYLRKREGNVPLRWLGNTECC